MKNNIPKIQEIGLMNNYTYNAPGLINEDELKKEKIVIQPIGVFENIEAPYNNIPVINNEIRQYSNASPVSSPAKSGDLLIGNAPRIELSQILVNNQSGYSNVKIPIIGRVPTYPPPLNFKYQVNPSNFIGSVISANPNIEIPKKFNHFSIDSTKESEVKIIDNPPRIELSQILLNNQSSYSNVENPIIGSAPNYPPPLNIKCQINPSNFIEPVMSTNPNIEIPKKVNERIIDSTKESEEMFPSKYPPKEPDFHNINYLLQNSSYQVEKNAHPTHNYSNSEPSFVEKISSIESNESTLSQVSKIEISNKEICSICKLGLNLLQCKACSAGAHPTCLDNKKHLCFSCNNKFIQDDYLYNCQKCGSENNNVFSSIRYCNHFYCVDCQSTETNCKYCFNLEILETKSIMVEANMLNSICISCGNALINEAERYFCSNERKFYCVICKQLPHEGSCILNNGKKETLCSICKNLVSKEDENFYSYYCSTCKQYFCIVCNKALLQKDHLTCALLYCKNH